MPTQSRSPREYLRLKSVRDVKHNTPDDLAETALPRYQRKTTRSDRRGDSRESRWLKYA